MEVDYFKLVWLVYIRDNKELYADLSVLQDELSILFLFSFDRSIDLNLYVGF